MKTLLFSILIIFSFSALSQDLAEEYKEKAIELYDKKDFQYAMVMIDKAIELDSKTQELYFLKAEIESNLTNPINGIVILQSAIKYDKKNGEIYRRIGSMYITLNMTDSAIANSALAISLAENDTAKYSYIFSRGLAKSQSRNFEGALKDYEEVLAFNPNQFSILNNISNVYDELGMEKKAISCLKRVIEIDSTFIGSYVNLGFIYSDMDSLDQAITYFGKALKYEPNEPLIFSNRGYTYYQKGEYNKALADINQSLKFYPTNSYAYRNLALVYIAQGQMDEACDALGYAEYYRFKTNYGDEVEELLKKYCKK